MPLNVTRKDDPDGSDIVRSRQEPTAPNRTIGQEKYARRAGAASIYKDSTRNTADDNAASKKAEGSSIFECEDEKTGEEY